MIFEKKSFRILIFVRLKNLFFCYQNFVIFKFLVRIFQFLFFFVCMFTIFMQVEIESLFCPSRVKVIAFLVIFALFVLFFSVLIWEVSIGLSREDRAYYRCFSTLFLRNLFELVKRIYGILFLSFQKWFLNFACKISTQNPWKKV